LGILRPKQEECLDAIYAAYMDGIYQQLIVQATGTGKTVVFANVIRKMRSLLPGKALVFAHREELVDQAVEVCKTWNPELKVGKEMSTHYCDTDCDIVVSCVASIGREGATRLQRFGEFDIVVCDEAHHSIAQTYLNVFEATGVLKPDSKKLLLGFTATPKRKNLSRAQKKAMTVLDDEEMLSLKSVYRKIVSKYTIREAIKDGWLVPIKGFRLTTDTDLSDVKCTAGDYEKDQLSEVVNTRDRNSQIVKAWLDWAERRTSLAFAVDIQHAKALAQEFRQAGVKAEAIWGFDPEREDKLRRLKADEIEVTCNCDLLIEGFDAWNVRCIILAAPTKSCSKFTQEIGRGTRLEEGTGNLLEALKAGVHLRKKDLYVIDTCDNNRRCSIVTVPSLVGLSPDFDLHGGSVTEAIDEIEKLQEKFPDISFAELTDLSKVKTFVEALDLFAEPYSEEVKEFSELTWMRAQDDSYVLAIPERRDVSASRQYWNYLHEKLHITMNELEEYELSITTVNSERKLGVFNTLKEAFETADDVVLRCRPDRVKLMQRNAGWRSGTASDASKKHLKKLVGKKPFIYCLCPVGPLCSGVAGTLCGICKKVQLTSGQASIAITRMKVK